MLRQVARPYYPHLIIWLLALSLRWAYSLALPAGVQLHDIDARGYHQIALNLLDGHGFSLNSEPPWLPDAIRTPAYPLFDATVYVLTGVETRHVALAQGLLDSGTVLLVIVLLFRPQGLFGRRPS